MSQTRAGRVPDESWACPRRELGVSQTRAGHVLDEWGEEPAQNINCFLFYFFSSFFLSVCVSVTEFSEVLPPFFPPPTFSSVRVGGGSGGGGWLWWY